jgi:hypothetical protein
LKSSARDIRIRRESTLKLLSQKKRKKDTLAALKEASEKFNDLKKDFVGI